MRGVTTPDFSFPFYLHMSGEMGNQVWTCIACSSIRLKSHRVDHIKYLVEPELSFKRQHSSGDRRMHSISHRAYILRFFFPLRPRPDIIPEQI